MGRKISDFNGGVIAPGGAYPYGQIKDNPAGTVIDVTSNGDIQQFFQRIAALSGLTLNDLEDNATNGWQYVDGMNGGINAYAAAIMINLLGPSYSTSATYVVSGAAIVSASGVVFRNGKFFLLEGYSGPACGGPNVPVISIAPSSANTFMPHMVVNCAASGSGLLDYSDLTRIANSWQSTTTGFTAMAPIAAPNVWRYSKNYITGTVEFQGMLRNALGSLIGAGNTIFTMPVGFRPQTQMFFVVIQNDAVGAYVGTNYIYINLDGTVVIGLNLAVNNRIDFSQVRYSVN